MKTKFLFLFWTVIFGHWSFAQKDKKPQVIVYGSGILGYSAAVQASLSGVSTLWILEDKELMPELSRIRSIVNLPNVDGGIWLKLLMTMALSKQTNDSLAITAKQNINPRLFDNALRKNIADQKNLAIVYSSNIVSIDKKRKQWEIKLQDHYTYLVDCVIDASVDQKLRNLFPAKTNKQSYPKIRQLDEFSPTDMRTLVATGEIQKKLYGIRLSDLIRDEDHGLFNLTGVSSVLDTLASTTPFRSAVGQALGATAAYLAFFHKESSEIEVRKLQSELMNYGARLLPLTDVAIDDPNFFAIQRVGLAAIFALQWEEGLLILDKERSVTYRDIEPIFNTLYTRSQLWSVDRKENELTLMDALSLIKFVGLRGDEIDDEVQRDWSKKLNFPGVFDLDQLLGRYEFMVLLERYANPYIKRVDQQGNFMF